MADYLPPVVARLSMDLGDFLSGIAKAKAAMQGLNGEMNIKTDGLDTAAAKVAALSKAMSGLSANIRVSTDGLGTTAAKITATGVAAGLAANGFRLWGLSANAIHWIIAGGAEIAAVTIPAFVALGAAMAVGAQGAQMVYSHMMAVYTATEATGQQAGQTAGSLIGLGGALQKAQNAANPTVYGILGSAIITLREHFGDLWATGTQVLQMFQTFSAKVAVDFGPGGGLGNTVNSLLSHMTSDLQGIGQLFGNLGHLLANLASAMPGLAEVLLGGLAAVTGFLAKLSGMAPILITVGMAFEEFNRWGGLVVTMLTKLGVASGSLSGGAFSLARFGSVVQGLLSVFPTLISMVGGLASKFSGLMETLATSSGEGAIASMFLKVGIGAETAGAEVSGFAEKLSGMISEIGPMQAMIGVGLAVGLGFLIDKLVTARTAAQEFGDALQQSVLKASNVDAFQTIAQNVASLNQQITQTKAAAPGLQAVGQAEDQTAASTQRFGAAMGLAGIAAMNARSSVAQFGAALKQQNQDAANVAAGAALIAKTYGTTFVGALALADEANVKLASGITGSGQAAMVARMQIASLVAGYKAMGAPAGEVGADMTALAIQSGLAGTEVSKLNSAWDDFVSGLTGGTSNLAQLGEALTNLSTGASQVTNVLGKAAAIKESIQGFATSLKSFTAAGAQAWQSFDSALSGPGEQLIDWFRTAGAEGAATGSQLKQAVLDIASSFVPLASQSKTAQAELLGLVQEGDPAIQTFSQLKSAIASSGASFGGLNPLVSSATQKMSEMNSVAQTLGNVLNTALVSALQAAQVQASGAGAAMQQYASALMSGNRAAAAADYQNVISDLEKLGLSAQQAAALIASVTQNLNNMPTSKTITITTDLVTQSISSGGGAPAGVKAPGHAAGTPSAPSGWAWVGEAGPELVKFRGGEQVLPNQVSMGFAEGTGGPYGGGDIHLYIDGRELSGVVAKRAIQTQRRTGSTGMTRRAR